MSYAYNQKRKRMKRLRKGLCPLCRTPLTNTGQCPKGDAKIDWSVLPPKVKEVVI